MPETQILSQILTELKDINNTIQDLYSSIEAQNEMIMTKFSSLESIAEKSANVLAAIESNTKNK